MMGPLGFQAVRSTWIGKTIPSPDNVPPKESLGDWISMEWSVHPSYDALQWANPPGVTGSFSAEK